MNKIIAYIAGGLFLLMFIFRVLYALLYPDKFAEGARKVLFIDARQKALFPPEDTDNPPNTTTDDNHNRNGHEPEITNRKLSKTVRNDEN